MDYNKLYELCDEIYDALEELGSKVDIDYVRHDIVRLQSGIEDVRGYIEDDEHDDYEETLQDVGRWLSAQQRVS